MRSIIVYDIFTGAEWTNFNSILDSFTHELDWEINTENRSEDVFNRIDYDVFFAPRYLNLICLRLT